MPNKYARMCDVEAQVRADCAERLREPADAAEDRRGILRERLLLHALSQVGRRVRALRFAAT